MLRILDTCTYVGLYANSINASIETVQIQHMRTVPPKFEVLHTPPSNRRWKNRCSRGTERIKTEAVPRD